MNAVIIEDETLIARELEHKINQIANDTKGSSKGQVSRHRI